MIFLSDHERDAISEAFNLGMGQAGDALSQMIGMEVLLSVPYVDITRRGDAAHRLCASQERDETPQAISCVRQEFAGPFAGNALLLFTEKSGLELVRILLQQPDADIETLTEMEQEALIEVGNIILNACLASIAEIIGDEIINEIPEAIKGRPQEILDRCSSKHGQEYMMQLKVHFNVNEAQITGNIAFIMDLDSLDVFRKRLAVYFGFGAA